MLFLLYSLPASILSFWCVLFALQTHSWLSAPGGISFYLWALPSAFVLGEFPRIFVAIHLRSPVLPAFGIYFVPKYILAFLLAYHKPPFFISELCINKQSVFILEYMNVLYSFRFMIPCYIDIFNSVWGKKGSIKNKETCLLWQHIY